MSYYNPYDPSAPPVTFHLSSTNDPPPPYDASQQQPQQQQQQPQQQQYYQASQPYYGQPFYQQAYQYPGQQYQQYQQGPYQGQQYQQQYPYQQFQQQQTFQRQPSQQQQQTLQRQSSQQNQPYQQYQSSYQQAGQRQPQQQQQYYQQQPQQSNQQSPQQYQQSPQQQQSQSPQQYQQQSPQPQQYQQQNSPVLSSSPPAAQRLQSSPQLPAINSAGDLQQQIQHQLQHLNLSANSHQSTMESQKKAFTRWVNSQIKPRGLEVTDLFTDLRNGLMLIALLEVLSHKRIANYTTDCKNKFQEISNLSLCFDLMRQEGIAVVNMGPQSIQEGNPKITLGLIFTLLLFYQIDPPSQGSPAPTVHSGEAKLLAWVGSRLPPGESAPTSFGAVDGKTICALVNSLQPGVISDMKDPLQNVQEALLTAESMFGVVKLLDAEDIVHNAVDPLSMMAYVSCLRDYALGLRPATVAQASAPPAEVVGANPVASNQGVPTCADCGSPVPVGNFCGVCGAPVRRASVGAMPLPASPLPLALPLPVPLPVPAPFDLQPPVPEPMAVPAPHPSSMGNMGWAPAQAGTFGAFPGGPNPYEQYPPESIRYSAPAPLSLPELIARYEIYNYQSHELALLRGYDLVFVCDDSGSMRTPLHTGRTRWDELKETVSLVVDIGRCFDDDGIDVYFLNRPALKHVACAADLQKGFIGPPAGFTPLTDTLSRVVAEQQGRKPLLILIATDGCPTTADGDPDTFTFRRAVERCTSNPHRMIRIQFLACSDDENDVGWLNVLDREVHAVDVTADYETERAEVLRSGKVNRFSRGDWVCKALLGGISDYYDKLDE